MHKCIPYAYDDRCRERIDPFRRKKTMKTVGIYGTVTTGLDLHFCSIWIIVHSRKGCVRCSMDSSPG